MHEGYFCPFYTFVITELGVVRTGVKVSPSIYALLHAEDREAWKAFLRLTNEQAQANLSELSQGEYPQD